MKKIVLKTTLFLSPILLIWLLTYFFYATDKGDLLRLGYIWDKKEFNGKKLFAKDYAMEKAYTGVSELKFKKKERFRLMHLGDSFSKLYSNQLAKYGGPILYFEPLLQARPNYPNSMSTICGLLNSGFFDTVQVDYVLLECVERSVINHALRVEPGTLLTIDSLMVRKERNTEPAEPKEQLFSARPFKFIWSNLVYLFKDKVDFSPVYRVSTTQQLFSTEEHKLIFLDGDIEALNYKNNPEAVSRLTSVLNAISTLLQNKGIKLMVMIAPDKYDVYYPYIEDKEDFDESLFFNFYNKQSKNYINVDAMSVLSKAVQIKKDIYLYDDTHWSPIASDLMSQEIFRLIKENNDIEQN